MNISKAKREKMLSFINKLREEHKTDDNCLIALGEIESALTSKKYGLVWEEHEEEVDKQLVDNIPVFVEDKSKEILSDDNKKFNFLLEGDNLHSLYLLEKTHKGKIDVIYIDPPYNTGNKDFIYDDRYIDSEDGFRHSKWASFIYKRLKIAKNLLKEDGFIAISIDDNEYAVLKLLCDDIFGSQNYMTTFHIQVRYPDKSINEEKIFKPLMEYILFYSKNNNCLDVKQEEVDYGLDKFCYSIKEKNSGEHFCVGNQEVVVFKPGQWTIEKIEGNLKGLKETWVTGSIYTTMSYGKVFQKIVEPRIKIDGYGCLYKVIGRGDDGLGFRYYTGPKTSNASKGKMYSGVPINKVEQIKNGDLPKKLQPILTAYDFAADFGNIRHEGGVPFGSGKKPVKMLKQIINYHKNKDAIILDFFAGSGSTAQAVLNLNNEDGGNRTFIMCTNNQNNICEEITYKRINNVISGNGNCEICKANLFYYKTSFISKTKDLLSDALNDHIKEMVQLEHMVKIDGKNFILLLDDEQADNLEKNWKNYQDLKGIYISKNVLLTSSQNELFNTVEMRIIPDFYFNFELKEVGETW